MNTEQWKKIKKTTLYDEISRRANAGKEGAIWIRRNAANGELCLCAGSKRLPLLRLHVCLHCDGKMFHMTEENFCGELALDDRGVGSETVRLALLNEEGQIVLSSDENVLFGSIYVVALLNEEKLVASCTTALMRTNKEKTGRSSVMWSNLADWLYFCDLLDEMLEAKKDCGTI